MDTPKFVIGPLSVLCILGLVFGTASALAMTATDTSSMTGAGHCQRPSPEDIINHLGEKGVDVSEARAALQNGDTEAVKAWLENYFQTHGPEKPAGTGHPVPDLTDTTRVQELITRLEERGVDVTEVKAALQNGDTASVKLWFDNYFQNRRPELDPETAHPRPDLTDTTQQQQIITRLEEKGVDVTEAEAEFESGDTSAVKVWLENYFHAHEGEMPFYHSCSESPTEIPPGTSSQSNQ
jgi:DNA-binding transcriptional MerR regulator